MLKTPLQISALNCDHSDSFPQFTGSHAFLPDGFMSVLFNLAQGLEVKLYSAVTDVELMREEGKGMQVKVTDTLNHEYITDRVCDKYLRTSIILCVCLNDNLYSTDLNL